MEKPTPHCKLPVVKDSWKRAKSVQPIRAKLRVTALGLELSDMLAVVMALTPTDLYRSMTTHADHTVWQDVYLKLTVIDDVLIVSFKEL